MDLDDHKYYLDHDELPDETDSEYKYEIVPLEDDVPDAGDEDLNATVRVLHEASEDDNAAQDHLHSVRPSLTTKPPSVDDFVRTFLLKMNMMRTLDSFQIEWFELQEKGLLNIEDVEDVPDIYVRNQNLDDELKQMRQERDKYKGAALKAKEMYIKLRNERDFHRLHHRRVAQEKNTLLSDLKKLKNHFAAYEPALAQLRKKYEVAMKEKMLSQLERDRAVGKVAGLESTLRSLEQVRGNPTGPQVAGQLTREASLHMCNRGGTVEVDQEGNGPTQRQLVAQRQDEYNMKDVGNQPRGFQRHPNDSEWPVDTRMNPILMQGKSPPAHLTRSGGFRLTHSWKAHEQAVSGLALHCDGGKQVLASVGDDHVWHLWSLPNGDLISSGQGHTDWVSGVDFHPGGRKLVTGSGDTTVKVWNLEDGKCVHTFRDHTAAVWGVTWHNSGNFLASSSMDNTSKIWDLGSLRCRMTLRGHGDSVNSIEFLPSGNTLLTSSADKTISLWDARNGLCAQTFYGHLHAVNNAKFNAKGDTIVSGDVFGFTRLWDVRACAALATIDLGHHGSNYCSFDSSSSCVAVASGDGNVKMVEVANMHVTQLVGHEDAVQACLFDQNGECLISGGSDLTIRIWS